MLRLLPVVLLASVAVAAPVPQESDVARMGRIFGVPVKPDREFKFEMVKNELRIVLPEGPMEKAGTSPEDAARVWREVTGDFTATVRTSVIRRPAAGFDAVAGLVAREPKNGEHVVIRREARYGDGIESEAIGQVYSYEGVTRRAVTSQKKTGEGMWLRLTRNGTQVGSAYSRDGKDWTEYFPDGVDWPDTVLVGVWAKNLSGDSFTAAFDEYTIVQPKKK